MKHHLFVILTLSIIGCELHVFAQEKFATQDRFELEVVDYQEEQILENLRDLQAEINYLDQKKEYELVYKLLKQAVSVSYSNDVMQYAISYTRKHINEISSKYSRKCLSHFVEPDISAAVRKKDFKRLQTDVKQYFKQKYGNGTINLDDLKRDAPSLAWMYISVMSAPVTGGISWAAVWPAAVRLAKIIEEEEAKKQVFALINKEEAQSISRQFDWQKEAVISFLSAMKDKYPLGASKKDKELFLKQKDELEQLKKTLIETRCRWVSYAIISPYLAEIQKQMFIAKGSFWSMSFQNKNRLRNAVSTLAHGFHNGWLNQASEDVRLQFFDVLKNLKNMVGAAEMEEYEVLTTILGSNDPSKKRGAYAWWDE